MRYRGKLLASTQVPWSVLTDASRLVATTFRSDGDSDRENAAHIVRTWNFHEPLIQVVDRLLEQAYRVERASWNSTIDSSVIDALRCEMEAARKVLANAKEPS